VAEKPGMVGKQVWFYQLHGMVKSNLMQQHFVNVKVSLGEFAQWIAYGTATYEQNGFLPDAVSCL
jgi:hypothetical protein